MEPRYTGVAAVAVVLVGVAGLVLAASPSGAVVAVAALVLVIGLVVVARRTEPLSVPAAEDRTTDGGTGEDGATGTVALLDRKGRAHTTLPFHRLAAVRVRAHDGAAATCARLPWTLVLLAEVDVELDGRAVTLCRRSAYQVDVVEEAGPALSLHLDREGGVRRLVARTAAGQVLRDDAVDDWTSAPFDAATGLDALASAAALAGIDRQLRPWISRFLSAI